MADNGFLFPVSAISYESFDAAALYYLIGRIKNTVELMTAVSEIKKNYDQIFRLLMEFLFALGFTLKTDSMTTAYQCCHHPYIDLLQNPKIKLSDERKQEA